MSSLAPIISSVDLDEDCLKANLSKYEKEQGTMKRQGEPLKSKSEKQARVVLPTVDTVPIGSQCSTNEEEG